MRIFLRQLWRPVTVVDLAIPGRPAARTHGPQPRRLGCDSSCIKVSGPGEGDAWLI
jgi:hypothetical protein